MQRTTQKHLESQINALNKALGLPMATYTKGTDGLYKANIGNLHLDHNLQGWQVQQLINDGGAVTCPLGDYRLTAQECWFVLHAAIGAAKLAKERCKLQEAA